MKSLSVGDEEGDLAEPRRISARVKNRNPTVPCWLSLMSAALVTELAASELPPLQFSIPPPPLPLLISLSFFLCPTLLHTHFFLSLPPPPCLFSLPVYPTRLHFRFFPLFSSLADYPSNINSVFPLSLCSTLHCCHTVFTTCGSLW